MSFLKFLTPVVKAAVTKKGKLKRTEKIAVQKAANKAAKALKVTPDEAVKGLRKAAKAPPPVAKKEGKFTPKKPNPKLKSDKGNVSSKNKREVKRLQKQQELDDMGTGGKERRKEMMTKEQYLESNPLERKAGAGSGPSVSGSIMRGKGVTRDQAKEIEEMAAEGKGFQIKKYGGKVKRNMGGPVRGVGAATRGFGNAKYSNKMY